MAGILDPKSRIMDVIITQTGKRQIASNDLRIEYVSFTDGDTFYSAEELKPSKQAVARNADLRPFFEACNLPRDTVCQDIDRDINMLPYDGPGFRSFGGESYLKTEGILTASGGTEEMNKIFDLPVVNIYQRATGSQMELIASGVFATSSRHFNQMNLIGTRDYYSDEDTLELSTTELTFEITTDRPIYTGGDVQTDANSDGFGDQIVHPSYGDLDPIWSSPDFAHLLDFSFLPPSVTWMDGTSQSMGNFVKLNGTPYATLDTFKKKVDGRDGSPAKEAHSITFLRTSRINNIFCQMYEKDTSASKLDKLIFVDMGSYPNGADWSANSRIVFAGKFYRDYHGSLCFAKIFTLVFE